jgi:hypothetical protein
VSGHIGHAKASKLNGHIVSVFRHPVDRFISVYYFWRYLFNTNIEVREATIIASKYSLDQFVRIRDVFALSEELCNRMTYQVAHGFNSRDRQWLRTEGKTDEDIYRMAADNVSRFAVVGIQEDLVDFETKIRRHFGLDISIGAVNQNDERLPTHEISFAAKSRILEWVYMDMELYDHVVRLCRERADRAPAEPPPKSSAAAGLRCPLAGGTPRHPSRIDDGIGRRTGQSWHGGGGYFGVPFKSACRRL